MDKQTKPATAELTAEQMRRVAGGTGGSGLVVPVKIKHGL